MKLVVLGPNGMLGSMLVYVAKKKDLVVQAIPKSDFDVLHNTLEDLSSVIGQGHGPVCIVNCIGCIPQRHYSEDEYTRINQKFPHELAAFCKKHEYGLVHISTNCVFRGTKPNCTEKDECDAADIYGKTKALGEPNYGLIIRSSIIGPERHTSAGLLSWFLQNKSPQVNGYLHQYWNGVTSLELSNFILNSLLEKAWSSAVLHVYSSRTVSKYELLQTTKRVFGKDIDILPYDCPLRYYTLASVREGARKDIEEQLHHLFDCYSDFMSHH